MKKLKTFIENLRKISNGYRYCPKCDGLTMKEHYCDYYKCESCGYWFDALWGHSGINEKT